MTYEQKILDHYRKEAAAIGLGKESTMHDEYIKDMEVKFILHVIDNYISYKVSQLNILDIGCGNGYLISLLSNKYKESKLWGLEFTEELYKLAESRKLENTTIQKGDCRVNNYKEKFFDIIISERVLINLLNPLDKLDSLRQIYSSLKEKGIYIMVEAFEEPLKILNKARSEMQLSDIKPAHHNEYLSEQTINSMKKIGFIEKECSIQRNFLSTHFFITRILHESLRPPEGTIKNTEFVKFFTKALQPAIGNYSPILFRVFEKK